MKNLLIAIISLGLVFSGYSQTRSVLVGTNNTVVSPTNFWSADASNARTGLGLGTAATNPSSAFQPSSLSLSNLASSNGANITNIQSSNIVGTISISGGGTGATNAATARTNLNLGASWLTNDTTSNFRSSIGLALSALTNTNNSNFLSAINLGWSALTNSNAGISLVSVDTNGSVVSPTNFWQQAPIATTVASSAPTTNSTNSATNSRNLILQSLSQSIVGVTNTILLPTNSSTFNGDTAVIIHSGGANSATQIRQDGSATNIIVLTNFDHAVRFLYSGNTWDFYHNLAYAEPIYFSGTNAAANAAASRTNLGIGWSALTNTNAGIFRGDIGLGWSALTNTNAANFRSAIGLSAIDPSGETIFYGNVEFQGLTTGTWAGPVFVPEETAISFEGSPSPTRTNLGIPLQALTNTNNANFQAAVFTTNTAPTNAANFADRAAWMEITVSTNGTNHSFRIPLYK